MAPKQNTGIVTSNKMNKTITVVITNKISHKKYNKIISKTKKYYAHDENNQCQIGDTVKIQETKPISKKKRWKLLEKII
uniref:Small ribosomal subunit protein uS17c n=1 Tax=Gastroclonium compressum TaxID=1852973 RepID=A0A173G055_GASCM|nr:30S ribosomal protein S17 [Coeloseira compressa]ANH09664.1 30S ribosomal protein S17 [Coeloseira compressa]